ncbi:sodium- and chloride-dependent glycine transporter 1-like [Drosophila pseudoobscura]|uniref:Sodium- and chloride-dependent glycine transporter 1-like n=2 Tax=pseudoobscura subgroup TaxID=32358 RepID=A0A6I8V874_DROPS|nr:sodium- and chloride-dependent glycine transporter 1 [Drosophila pseudoobscura]XP_015035843.2 sodium- and chloride-dependent glycine transporter 1 [Drosophila pseudoobscura]XP_015035845.2 sodium- and chloride-dependent glycine transporter 1 [Drosophila pseudoobscura]
MKGICGEQLNNCMLLGDCENGGDGAAAAGVEDGVAVGGGGGGGGGGGLAASARRVRLRQVQSMAVPTTSAYDTLERPYRHDKARGRWAKSADFYFASCTHAFTPLMFSELPTFGLVHGGWVLIIIAYLMGIFFYSLPIFLIQAFLGQFSTSGSISAFRVAPIFKGIGYSILLINLGTLSYYSIGAVVPLIYAVNALHAVIPWTHCNNTWNSDDCSTHDNYDPDSLAVDPHSTVEFFRSMIASTGEGSTAMTISLSMLVAVGAIWLLVLALLLKPVAFIGKTLRCACVLMFAFFVAVFFYLAIHEGVDLGTFHSYLLPPFYNVQDLLGVGSRAFVMAGLALGPGCGSIINLASYNSFRSDAERMSVWVCLTHATIGLMAVLCCNVAHDHFEDHVGMLPFHVDEKHDLQYLYLSFSYLFGRFSTVPNLWAFLFFVVIFLAELSALVIQLLSVVTSLFDEFECLRSRKMPIICTLIFCLAATSVYFCTQLGFSQLNLLPRMALFSNVLISGVLVLMATVVYGRVRFQCDLQFMLGKTISSFTIFFIRFGTPIFLGLCLGQLVYYLITFNEIHQGVMWLSQGLLFLLAIVYMVYRVTKTNGSFRQRLQQCLAPHDWHPVDADNRRFYEEIMGISEMLVIDANANNT